MEKPGDRPGHALRPRIEGRVIAYEPENVDGVFARILHREVELLCPAASLALVLAKRVAGLLKGLRVV